MYNNEANHSYYAPVVDKNIPWEKAVRHACSNLLEIQWVMGSPPKGPNFKPSNSTRTAARMLLWDKGESKNPFDPSCSIRH